jgi:addiction module RelE/StbE family toxin
VAGIRSLKLSFSDRARSQLDSIRAYVHERNPAAARGVGTAIRGAAERLRSFPFAGRVGAAEGTREWVVRGFPYILVYEVLPDEVMILGVFHAAQDRSEELK